MRIYFRMEEIPPKIRLKGGIPIRVPWNKEVVIITKYNETIDELKKRCGKIRPKDCPEEFAKWIEDEVSKDEDVFF